MRLGECDCRMVRSGMIGLRYENANIWKPRAMRVRGTGRSGRCKSAERTRWCDSDYQAPNPRLVQDPTRAMAAFVKCVRLSTFSRCNQNNELSMRNRSLVCSRKSPIVQSGAMTQPTHMDPPSHLTTVWTNGTAHIDSLNRSQSAARMVIVHSSVP